MPLRLRKHWAAMRRCSPDRGYPDDPISGDQNHRVPHLYHQRSKRPPDHRKKPRSPRNKTGPDTRHANQYIQTAPLPFLNLQPLVFFTIVLPKLAATLRQSDYRIPCGQKKAPPKRGTLWEV